MRLHYLRKMLGIPGYFITNFVLESRGGRPTIVIELKRLRRPFECGTCHRRIKRPHSHWQIEVQHLMWWHYPTLLQFHRYQLKCPRCGFTSEPVPFVSPSARVTRSLASLVAELCKVMSVQAVAVFQSLHRCTVKTIDKTALQKTQTERSLEGITVLGVDEISVGKGQTYWTMVSALEGPRGPEMLAVVEGRKERNLTPFWKWFGQDRAQRITHGVMDMWKPFRNSFRTHCPSIQIIYDKFHVIRHLLVALNEVRKAEFQGATKRLRGLLSGKKFILLSRQAHVRGNARQALHQVLGASRKLFKAHLLKESFPSLWSYTSKTWAMKFFRGWVEQLKWSRLKPYHKFSQMMERHLDGILAYCDKKVSLGYIESSNLKARNVIRRAYGYRDKEYMKLKIIQACSPWMNQFKPWGNLHENSS